MTFKNLLISALLLTTYAHAKTPVLTDEMALEEGMTPISSFALKSFDPEGIMNTERSNYVTSIPSAEDIEKVIRSHRQVIVINKAASGKDAQTLRVYQNGAIRKLKELTKVNGKEVLLDKEFVKISTGREKTEVAASGRRYFSTTPKGFFRPQRVFKMYYSNTWKADMPNAMFINCSRADFNKECGIAIHATTPSHYNELGKRDSGGCVRTRLEVSKQLRELVMETGLGLGAGRIQNEGYRRDKIVGNSIQTDLIDRDNGDILNQKINSWDTVIVIYE